jgi:hypothetical protein
MKQEFKPLSWHVKNFDCNKQVIEDYNILKYREDDIKKMKKKYTTKEEFDRALKSEMLYIFWSRSEYELIIRLTDDGRVILLPWCGSYNPEKQAIDVTNDTLFDWFGFAKEHIGKQIYRNEAKIDVFSQLDYVWDNFVDYVWNYRHKWQRHNK